MQIVVKAGREQKKIFESLNWSKDLEFYWVENNQYPTNAALYFDFCFEEEGWFFEAVKSTTVFVNAVIKTSQELPSNAIRMNAWNSFLNRPIWEIASSNQELNQEALILLEKIGRKAILTPDEPGFIAMRVIAMIINEAYFALAEKISTKEEIDIAMKLGTNYPWGPFEWASMIGISKIVSLLEILKTWDDRYTVAPALIEEWSIQNNANEI